MLGKNLLGLFVAAVQIYSVTPVIHTFNYFKMGSQVATLPEYLVMAYVDGVQILQFDSYHRETKAIHDWVNKITEDDPDFWKRETEFNIGNEQVMKVNIETAKKRFNQTGGVHMIQVMRGCEWDDETAEVDGWQHVRYDGEDFLSFEAKTMTWIAANPQAFVTKLKLDQIDGLNEVRKNILTEVCPFELKKHVSNGRDYLTKTEDTLLSGHLPRHGFLPQDIDPLLEEERRGDPQGRGDGGDPPQPRRNLPDLGPPESGGDARRGAGVRMRVPAGRRLGRHRHQAGHRKHPEHSG
nr:class I histocompatibility antigen, F10 alpha chain-like isoform X2 [Syngnathus scovelli]